MSSARAAIPVLGFHAGELALAIAAEDVVAVESLAADCVHIAKLLTIAPGPRTDARRRISVRGRASRDEAVDIDSFAADPPVEMLLCRAQDIVPAAAGGPLMFQPPVMGCAHIGQRLLLLLDISGLIRALRELRSGGQT